MYKCTVNKDHLKGARTRQSTLSAIIKGIVSPDWKGLQMISLDRFEV
jgi:hypothetical protein